MTPDDPDSKFNSGDASSVPVSVDHLRMAARDALPPDVWDFLAGGAGLEDTVSNNRHTFRDWQLQHRCLRDVSECDLGVELCGQFLEAPILLAPIGAQSVFHQDAEGGVARAAAGTGVSPVFSTTTTIPLESLAEQVGDVTPWFQLYFSKDRELTESLVTRAEEAGYKAIVVTVDTPTVGWRGRDQENQFFAPVEGDPHAFANFFSDPVFQDRLNGSPESDPEAAFDELGSIFPDPTVTWDDLEFLRELTSLPILLKGIVHPKDAKVALEYDIDGIVVSNHGGRQVDGGIGTLWALDRVASVVGDEIPLLLDGGIRCGADIVKALALGASAVFLGRPYIYGLAIDGQSGVVDVIENLRAELKKSLQICGCRSPKAVSADHVVDASQLGP